MIGMTYIRKSRISGEITGVFEANEDGSCPDVELRTEELIPINSMNLLTSLLYAIPPAPPPKKVRRVVAKEMREREQSMPVRDSSYGTVQPAILKLLGDSLVPMSPYEIGAALNLNKDAVRRGLRSLHSQKKIVQVRKSDLGRHIPSLWKIA